MSLIDSLRDGTDQVFTLATETALDTVLSSDIPIVGDALKAVLTGSLLAAFHAAIDDAYDQAEAATSAKGLADIINDAGVAGLTAAGAGKILTLDFVKSDSITVDPGKLSVGVGDDALGFSLKTELAATLALGIDVRLTLNTDTGEVKVVDKAGDALSIELIGDLKNLEATGTLGPISLSATDAYAGHELDFKVAADIAGGKVASLDGDDLSYRASGAAHLDLALVLGPDDDPDTVDVLPTIRTDFIVDYQKLYDPNAPESLSLGGPTLEFHNIELELGSLLQFIGGLFEPLISDVFGSFPIKPLLNTLTAALPVIDAAAHKLDLLDDDGGLNLDYIDDDTINLLDLAGLGATALGATREQIEAFAKAFSLVKALSNLAEVSDAADGTISLGSRFVPGFEGAAGLLHSPGAAEAANGLDALADALAGLAGQPGDPTGMPGGANSLADILDPGSGFAIPLLSDPSKILELLTLGSSSTPTDLITYNMPELSYQASFHQFFSVVGPIGVEFSGGFGAGIDIDVGYDTKGLTSGHFIDGFYFTTPTVPEHPVGDETSTHAPAATVDAEIGAGVAVNVGIAEAGVEGGVFAGLQAYLGGIDGKVRFEDFGHCTFDPIIGEFGVKVQVYFRVGLGPFSYTKRIDIVKVTLADFSYGCPPPETDPAGGLASLANAQAAQSELWLNAGSRASKRVINEHAGSDIDETYVIGNAANGSGALTVTAFALTDINGHPLAGATKDDKVGVTKVLADMGEMNDQVAFLPGVTVAAELHGGNGDDLLATGSGADDLYGDAGLDRLIGGAGVDHLYGGVGDDELEGGAGGDWLYGGDGAFDQATYENSTAGVTITPDAVAGSFTGQGGEAQGDHLSGIEHLIGSHFKDQLTGTQNAKNILEGLDGGDTLKGGNQDDMLIGGGGADALIGGAGRDFASYITSTGQVSVNLSTGKGDGGDAEGDTYDSIENVQGTFGDDTLVGNSAANVFDGWYGDDTLSGGAGKDELYGGAGSDIIYGVWDGDLIDGGGGFGDPGRDTLSYAFKSGNGVYVNLWDDTDAGNKDHVARMVLAGVALDHYSTIEDLAGSNGFDALFGDDKANKIWGFAGQDTIRGYGGNDTLIGGAGADKLDGGDGVDTADYSGAFAAVTANLATGGTKGDANGDSYVSVENLVGTRFVDTLTGDGADNRIDAGLSGDVTTYDVVKGGGQSLFGGDTLVVNWAVGDIGKGLVGGYVLGSLSDGAFNRQQLTSPDRLDGVQFFGIEKLEVYGTVKADIVNGGAGADFISTGDGNDLVYSGTGHDRVYAGAGTDGVAVNTDKNGILTTDGNFTFADIEGGAGIDVLSISLAGVKDSKIELEGNDGTTEFNGVNLYGPGGAIVSGFELLYAVATGWGDDTLIQPGRWDNIFATGLGADTIDAGQGKDTVDGGLDFRVGLEIKSYKTGQAVFDVVGPDFSRAFANDGDRLTVDYRTSTGGIFSQMALAQTDYSLRLKSGGQTYIENISVNSGYYKAGADKVTLTNVERVEVLGTQFKDGIFGTDIGYGLNQEAGPDHVLVASDSRRGDDLLFGFGGNDVLVGGTGDDTLDGGDGNDVLYGCQPGGRAQQVNDLGEIDQLVGGAGRDVFVLGLAECFYTDAVPNDGGASQEASTANRAIVTDFNKSLDTLLLSASPARGNWPATAYESVTRDGNTYIYLRDGHDAAGNPDPSNNELIAEITGVTGVSLTANYVVYITDDGHYVHGDGTPADPPGPLAGAPALDPAAMIAAMAAHADAQETSAPAAPTSIAAVDPGRSTSLATLEGEAAPAASSWVKQSDDADVLRQALFGNDSVLGSGKLVLEGDGRGFGTFKGDPFGLGSGIILSTGRVADVAGPNLVDGGAQPGPSVELKFEVVGTIDTGGVLSTIYKADLSNLGFDLNSLKLGDSGSGFGGGTGIASGFDIDAIRLSTDDKEGFTDASQFQALDRIDAFAFDYAHTQFTQGTLRDPTGTAIATAGVVDGLPDFDYATLNQVDSNGNLVHSLTLGDGGSLGLDLTESVKTDGPLYLYIAEAGGTGETITSGFTASSDHLTAPTDLSTDLGSPGIDGDTIAMTYTFQPRTDVPLNQVAFDVVFFSEEFAEFAQAGFNDTFKITLNGVSLARLSDGSFASVDTLANPLAGPDSYNSIWELQSEQLESDLIYNPVGTGPAAGQTRADGYSKTLHVVGDLNPAGVNVLRIEVADAGDAFLDSGMLIKGHSFKGSVTGDFQIDKPEGALHEGQSNTVDFGINLPQGRVLSNPVTVVFTPDADLDLGKGAGVAVTRELRGDNLFGSLTYTVVGDGYSGRARFDTIDVQVRGLPGTTAVAPIVVQVDDSVTRRTYTVGDAPATYDPQNPDVWARAWSHDGLTFTHTDNYVSTRTTWTAVDFSNDRHATLAGGDILRGDLGVSGMAGARTADQHEIGGTEALRLQFASRDVTDLQIHFARFERGDLAHVQLFDASGSLVRDYAEVATSTLKVNGVEDIASVVVFADAGGFVLDDVKVSEFAVVPRPTFVAGDEGHGGPEKWGLEHDFVKTWEIVPPPTLHMA